MKYLIYLILAILSLNLAFATICYQESANVSNQTGIDGSCGLNYTGSYYVINSSDGFYINYTKPSTYVIDAQWEVKTGVVYQNITLPDVCYNAYSNKLRLEIVTTSGFGPSFLISKIYCYNGTDFFLLRNVSETTIAAMNGGDNKTQYLYDGNWTSGIWHDYLYNGWVSTDRANALQTIYEEAMLWNVITAPTTVTPRAYYNQTINITMPGMTSGNDWLTGYSSNMDDLYIIGDNKIYNYSIDAKTTKTMVNVADPNWLGPFITTPGAIDYRVKGTSIYFGTSSPTYGFYNVTSNTTTDLTDYALMSDMTNFDAMSVNQQGKNTNEGSFCFSADGLGRVLFACYNGSTHATTDYSAQIPMGWGTINVIKEGYDGKLLASGSHFGTWFKDYHVIVDDVGHVPADKSIKNILWQGTALRYYLLGGGNSYLFAWWDGEVYQDLSDLIPASWHITQQAGVDILYNGAVDTNKIYVSNEFGNFGYYDTITNTFVDLTSTYKDGWMFNTPYNIIPGKFISSMIYDSYNQIVYFVDTDRPELGVYTLNNAFTNDSLSLSQAVPGFYKEKGNITASYSTNSTINYCAYSLNPLLTWSTLYGSTSISDCVSQLMNTQVWPYGSNNLYMAITNTYNFTTIKNLSFLNRNIQSNASLYNNTIIYDSFDVNVTNQGWYPNVTCFVGSSDESVMHQCPVIDNVARCLGNGIHNASIVIEPYCNDGYLYYIGGAPSSPGENDNFTYITIHSGFNDKLNITLYDQVLFNQIQGYSSIRITGDSYDRSYNTTTGNFTIYNLAYGTYSIQATNANYTQKTISLIVNQSQYQAASIYLLNTTDKVIFTIKDKDSLIPIQNALLVSLQLINGTYQVVDSSYSDISGKVQLYYIPDSPYKFYVTKSGYQDYTFQLNPILSDAYDLVMSKQITVNFSATYDGISVVWSPNEFYNNQNTTFSMLLLSPYGYLTTYGYEIITPNGTQGVALGSNPYGSEMDTLVNIEGLKSTDVVTINYFYVTNLTQRRNLTITLPVIDNSSNPSILNTVWTNHDEHYGMSAFERILLATIVVLITVGIAALMGQIIPGFVLGMFMYGYMAFIHFISFWAIIPGMVLAILLLAWRSGGT